jgi:magnesium transporter
LEKKDHADINAVLRSDDATASAFLRLVSHPADLVEVLRIVDMDEWGRLLLLIQDLETRAEILASLDEDERDILVEQLPKDELSSLLSEMDSDDAADVIGELEPDEKEEALSQLEENDRAVLEALLSYPEDSAGGIMQVERAQVSQETTVAETISMLRELVQEGIDPHLVYVVKDDNQLVGCIDIVDLVLNPSERQVGEFAEQPDATVKPLLDQEKVADLFRKYDLVALPVVDDTGRLLGRILFDDIVDVLTEEAEEDALLMAGTDREELLYRDRPLRIALVRLPWIGINLFGSLIAAFLLHFYESVMEQAIIIAAFIPVITAMGGNVGTQSATIITRGLATGRVDFRDLPKILFREFRVGLFMGMVCGVGVGFIAVVLFGSGRIFLGLVVGIAMVSAMTAAALAGTMAPVAMKKMNIDPAIASGPFVTTANDIIGILIYMSTAIAFIEYLK